MCSIYSTEQNMAQRQAEVIQYVGVMTESSQYLWERHCDFLRTLCALLFPCGNVPPLSANWTQRRRCRDPAGRTVPGQRNTGVSLSPITNTQTHQGPAKKCRTQWITVHGKWVRQVLINGWRSLKYSSGFQVPVLHLCTVCSGWLHMLHLEIKHV